MTSGKTKSKISLKEIAIYLFSVFLAIGFLYFAFKDVDFHNLMISLSGASIFWIILLCFVQMLSHYFRALRWKVILHSVKPNVSTLNLLGSLMIGYAINGIIPRLGEVTKAVSAARLENISRTSLFGTVIVERVIDLIFFALAVIIGGLLYEGNIYLQFPWLKTSLYFGIGLFTIAAVILFLTIRYREKFFGKIINLFAHFSVNFAQQLDGIFKKLISGFASLRGLKNYSLVFLYSIFVMFFYACASYCGLLSLHLAKFTLEDFSRAWIIMSIGSIGVIIPTPGGIGSYHAITKSVMTGLFTASFTVPIAAAFATLTHGVTYILHIIIALISFVIFTKKMPSLKTEVFSNLDELEVKE